MIATVPSVLTGAAAMPATVISDTHRRLNRDQLQTEIEAMAQVLIAQQVQRLAIIADNGIDWVVADLACQRINIVALPVPLFFSAQQRRHALAAAGISHVCVGAGVLADVNAAPTPAVRIGQSLSLIALAPAPAVVLPEGTQKITFTSGSTGTPKGVCLSLSHQLATVQALLQRVGRQGLTHLCLLPLATLLENLAGVYAPIMSGGTVLVPPLASVGLSGSSGLDISTLLTAIEHNAPNSLILLPQMLQALVVATTKGWHVPRSLQFVAVGGAKVAPNLISAAVAAGIPVYQGYGLSECGSVVALSDASCQRSASVGKPLAHVDVSVNQGELVVRGNVFLGYVGAPESWYATAVHTGDMGDIDRQGMMHLLGRKTHVQVSSFGRNLNPEWVESELLAGALFKHAVVYTEAKPYTVALLEPYQHSLSTAQIEAYIASVNTRLPDYAQIRRWALLPQALAATPTLLTSNGRVKREAFYQYYDHSLQALYQPSTQEPINAVF